jgi:hypothetical protein
MRLRFNSIAGHLASGPGTQFSQLSTSLNARPGKVLLLFLTLWICIIGTGRCLALEAVEGVDERQLPADFGKLHFYLLTIDVGNMLWDNFGHTALRVVDENDNTDTVYNWGLFDTSGGLVRFSFNFFKGIMNYQLGANSPAAEFAMYRRQQRTVWQEKINLNNQQKEVLYKRLLWNTRPENIVYPYDYFDDNCTTRVRDYLDEALSGKIFAATNVPTGNTFRDLVKYHYRSLALIELSLDLLMNSNIDQTVSQWEEMFLPLSLRGRLLGLTSDVAIAGERQPLLSDSTVIMDFPTPQAQPNPYYFAGTFLLAPTLLMFLLLRKVSMSYFATHSRITLKAPGFSFRILGLVGLLTALFSGIYGCLMLGGWFFSGHDDLYNNVNLLLCWPTDLLGAVIAGRWLLLARPWPLTHNSSPFINYYMLARLSSVLVYAVLAGFELTSQELQTLLVTLAPGMFLFIVLIWVVGFEPARSKNLLR